MRTNPTKLSDMLNEIDVAIRHLGWKPTTVYIFKEGKDRKGYEDNYGTKYAFYSTVNDNDIFARTDEYDSDEYTLPEFHRLIMSRAFLKSQSSQDYSNNPSEGTQMRRNSSKDRFLLSRQRYTNPTGLRLAMNEIIEMMRDLGWVKVNEGWVWQGNYWIMANMPPKSWEDPFIINTDEDESYTIREFHRLLSTQLFAKDYRSRTMGPYQNNPAMRRNVSDQRKALREKYRAKHGNDWWQDDSIKAKFDAELKKTPKGSFTRGGKTIAEPAASKSRGRGKKKSAPKKSSSRKSSSKSLDILKGAGLKRLAKAIETFIPIIKGTVKVMMATEDGAHLVLGTSKYHLVFEVDPKNKKSINLDVQSNNEDVIEFIGIKSSASLESMKEMVYDVLNTAHDFDGGKLLKSGFAGKSLKQLQSGSKKSSSRKSSAKSRAKGSRKQKAEFKIRKSGKSFKWELVIGGDIAQRAGYKSRATAKKALLGAIAKHEKLIEDRGVDTFKLYCDVRDSK